MPRPQRIEYPGAWYHVMNRGAGRRVIFRTNAQRQGFLEQLGEVSEIYGIAAHAYCLMGNHYHLLIHTPRGNLSAAMRHLNSVYTQRFNRSIGTEGPLFRGRYKAGVVAGDAYLAQLSRYIHLNPAAAGVNPRADQYRWSSYGAYLGKRRAPAWLHRDVTLALFGARRPRERYRAFVEQGVDEELKAFYGKKNLSSILGSAGFLRALRRKQQAKVLPKPARRATLPSLQRIAQVSAAHFGVATNTLFVSARGRGATNLPRSVAMALARRPGGYSLKAIAEAFGAGDVSTVSASATRLRTRAAKEPKLGKRIHAVERKLFTD